MVYYIPLQRKYTDLPVAQLDSASDSDSEGQRFESVRVGQKTQETAQPSLVFFRLFNRSRELLHHNRPAVVRMGSKPVIALRRICPSKKQVS